jgi:Ca2+-transporting ATPase
LEVAALCSDAIVRAAPDGFVIEGTPTECALIEAALALGTDIAALRLSAPVLMTAPRGHSRKRMSTLHETPDGGRLLCVKGDPTEVLGRCTRRRTREGIVPLDQAARAVVLKANERMAGRALRVLGVAVAETDGDPHNERDLVWLGLAGLANPIRPSVVPALERLHGAGIRTVMITGDQTATAFAIARNLDLGDGDDLRVLEAGQITGLPHDVLSALVAKPQVFARVSPVDKLNIVKALQASGRIVAMTGDGINDGPALRAADVGIAMGGEGTDVAREVADIVLASDDLDGIIEAIRLGRTTYANIRKVLRYLVSTNASESFTMLGAAIAGGGEPLTPMQLLWLNLASDVLPALALGLEPPESDVLQQPPHDPRAPILTPSDFRHILREGAVMGSAALVGYILSGGAAGAARASTVTFHGLTLAQLLHGIASRSETRGFAAEFYRPASPKLYGALAASAALQFVVQLFPATRRLIGLAPIGPNELLGIAGLALGATAANDTIGYLLRDGSEPSRPPLF